MFRSLGETCAGGVEYTVYKQSIFKALQTSPSAFGRLLATLEEQPQVAQNLRWNTHTDL